MNFTSALTVLDSDKSAEFFNMRFVEGKLEIVILAVEEFGVDRYSVNAIFESLNPFSEDYINELEEDLLPAEECGNLTKELTFIDKNNVPYFAIGYEAEHILWTIFPDLPDPDDIVTQEEKEDFIEQANRKLEALFSA